MQRAPPARAQQRVHLSEASQQPALFTRVRNGGRVFERERKEASVERATECREGHEEDARLFENVQARRAMAKNEETSKHSAHYVASSHP